MDVDVPFLGTRECYVLEDGASLLISVDEDAQKYGNLFIYSHENGPYITLQDGTIVYLDATNKCPELNPECHVHHSADGFQRALETFDVPEQSFLCSPCNELEAAAKLDLPGNTTTNADILKPKNCAGCCNWSCNSAQPAAAADSTSLPVFLGGGRPAAQHTKGADSRRQTKKPATQLQRDVVPDLVLDEDKPTIGNRHGSAARSTHATRKTKETLAESSPYFLEIFSGSGRLAAAVRMHGVTAYEIDLCKQGGSLNLLRKSVMKQVKELIDDPRCIGVWFGFPCGTFSSARRDDGGPPPLRGTNSKDIWGYSYFEGKEAARVQSANKLLLRTHELMRLCEKLSIPFYLENPRRSKLWNHPLITKWMRHEHTKLVHFDYCQYGMPWKKSTSVLAYNNKHFNNGISATCRETWKASRSICSRSGTFHETLSGFVGNKSKGQYKTNRACPYPEQFAKMLAKIIVVPDRLCETYRHGPGLFAAASSIVVEKPPADHYLTHLPKHPGCMACQNCKMQRKHCRDKNNKKQKGKKVIVLNMPDVDKENAPEGPKRFGDLVTSDSIFVLKKKTKKQHDGDTTALIIKDRGSGWLMGYPAASKAAEEMRVDVQDFVGGDQVKLWYSDGALELHAACRAEGIRRDQADPNRHETHGVIERANRTVIEGARTCLYQSGLQCKYWKFALQCFCLLYDFAHKDAKKGTNPHVERHGKAFGGKLLPFGCHVRYLPNSSRELKKRDKLDASLRDGIFLGYRMHTGGRWTGQYYVVDYDRLLETADSKICAIPTSVSELYVPGTAADDSTTFPQFPAAAGTVSGRTSESPGSGLTDDTRTDPDDLAVEPDECKPSHERLADENQNTEINGDEEADSERELGRDSPRADDRDTWSVQGSYLVRTHNRPRTALFSPLEAADDLPPIDLKHIDVARTTRPIFSGQQWPSLELIEDCWNGHPSDQRAIQHPDDGSTLTWTGETMFERVLPKPPKGKTWCGPDLVRARRGSKRAPDVHPYHWHLMSQKARDKAILMYSEKYKAIQQAKARRTIPREPLDEMPVAEVPEYGQQLGMHRLDVMPCLYYLDHEDTTDEDEMPELEAESSDDDHFNETLSQATDCSFDSDFEYDDFDSILSAFQMSHQSPNKNNNVFDEENTTCATCLKPSWSLGRDVSTMHHKDFCCYSLFNNTTDDQQLGFVPSMERVADAPNYAMMFSDQAHGISLKYQKDNSDYFSEEARRCIDKDPTLYTVRALQSTAACAEPNASAHRDKEAGVGDQLNPLIAWYALVAKPIPRKDWDKMPKAKDAVNAEWGKLRKADTGKGTWDESTVREYWHAQNEARDKLAKTGVHTHFGTLFDLCHEKHSELPVKQRRCKGRVVFGGHRIHDEFGLAAEFPDQGSGASFISASKLCDAVSLLPGNGGEQSDAPSAYTQAKLQTGAKGAYVKTWIELPKSQWPQAWHDAGFKRPVCELRLSLYGHPMSGKYWENHFTQKLLDAGFTTMPGWECLFVHEQLKLILSVYVDDFKLVGRQQNLQQGWDLMRQHGLVLDQPTPLGAYLGCGQRPHQLSAQEAQRRLENVHPLLKKAGAMTDASKVGNKVNAIRYEMTGFFKQCVDVYCDLANVEHKTLRKVATPSLDDHQLKPDDFEHEGALSKDAAKIIMKALYGARLVRYELLWPICSIARQVSKWTIACDKRLLRLMSYIYHTLDHSLESFVGDDPALCRPVVYSDADFAGDLNTAKSTSGAYVAIAGPNTFAPVTAICKKQTCVSHSSTESEIVAAELAVRTEGLQILTFWNTVTKLFSEQQLVRDPHAKRPRPAALDVNPHAEEFDAGKYFAYTQADKLCTDLIVVEDNEAVIKLVRKARSMALRHLPRTHRIDLHWLFEVCADPHVKMVHVGTKEQIADLMTKAFTAVETWKNLLQLAQIHPERLASVAAATISTTRAHRTPRPSDQDKPDAVSQDLVQQLRREIEELKSALSKAMSPPPPLECVDCGLMTATPFSACSFCT